MTLDQTAVATYHDTALRIDGQRGALVVLGREGREDLVDANGNPDASFNGGRPTARCCS